MSKFDVFISHASEDSDLVKETLERLRTALPRLRVWVDFESIQPGQDWADEVTAAASGSELLLVFGTKAAFDSRWVQHEIGMGLQRKAFDKIPFVILAFDQASIPADLRRYQYVDFSDYAEGIQRLTEFLRDQFEIRATRRRTQDSIGMIERGKIYAFIPCPNILAALPRATLRQRICKYLSREQVAVIWYDVFESRMADELPVQSLPNCVVELLLRCKSPEQSDLLYAAICNEYPQVAGAA